MRIVSISLVISFFLISFDLSSQTLEQINKKLDSLTKIQKIQQKKIDLMQESLSSTMRQIEKYESIKVQLDGNKREINKKIKVRVVHEGGILRDSPLTGSKSIGNIKANEDIYILGYGGNLYFKVQYMQKTGYLIYSSIESNEEVDKMLIDENKKNSYTRLKEVDANDPKYLRLSKLYGKEIAIKLINKELWEGMSPGMILESIGKPEAKTSKKTDKGLMEQWNYGNKTLFIDNGELKKWIDK